MKIEIPKSYFYTHVPIRVNILIAWGCFILGIMLSLLLLYREQVTPSSNELKKTESIIWLLDNSLSMATEDIIYHEWKTSRILAAKELISEYITAHPEKLYGLIAFSREPRLISPITSTPETIINFLSSLRPVNFQWGSNIESAIDSIRTRYSSWHLDNTVSVVILTDGGEEWDIGNLGYIPSSSLQYSIIGLGTEIGANIPIGMDAFGWQNYKMYGWKPVLSIRNDENLSRLSKILISPYIFLEKFDIDTFSDAIPQGKIPHTILPVFHIPGRTTWWYGSLFLLFFISFALTRYRPH